MMQFSSKFNPENSFSRKRSLMSPEDLRDSLSEVFSLMESCVDSFIENYGKIDISEVQKAINSLIEDSWREQGLENKFIPEIKFELGKKLAQLEDSFRYRIEQKQRSNPNIAFAKTINERVKLFEKLRGLIQGLKETRGIELAV
jgi:hypothetical protein